MSKKKKTKQKSKIKANARSIIIVVILVAGFSGLSFYLGMASPRSFSIPISLSGALTLSLDYDITLSYGPAHTGIRVSFEVTSTSNSWTVTIIDGDGNPVDALSGSSTGTYETVWNYSPDGCTIQIHASATFPTSMNLDGTLTITSSRFPFI